MRATHLMNPVIGVVLTIFVGLTMDDRRVGWAPYVVGAVVSLVLWYIIYFGRQRTAPTVAAYAVGAVGTAVGGLVLQRLGLDVAYPVATIIGAVAASMTGASSVAGPDHRQRTARTEE